MPKFAANITWLFTELDFLDRFAAAAAAGFGGVEFLFPYAFKTSDIVSRLQDNNLEVVLMNAPPGDWEVGDRGLACLAGQQAAFRDSVTTALDYATAIGCPRVHIMAGVGGASDHARYIDNLQCAARACGEAGVRGLIEPINTHDMPGYFLNNPEQAMTVLQTLASPHLGLQLDLYHVARMGLNPGDAIDACIGEIGHIQIAGVPERHEPDSGEVNYPPLFNQIDRLGYSGWIGCEYSPRASSQEGLSRACQYLQPESGA